MTSDENLLIAVFKEIAVIQGKRTPDGQWTNANPWHVQNALEVAMRVIANAKITVPEAPNAAVPFASSRKR